MNHFVLIRQGSDEDLEYYITEVGETLGIKDEIEMEKYDANSVLTFVFKSLLSWKMLNQN